MSDHRADLYPLPRSRFIAEDQETLGLRVLTRPGAYAGPFVKELRLELEYFDLLNENPLVGVIEAVSRAAVHLQSTN